MQTYLKILVAYVGAFNTLIHMRETCRSNEETLIIGPDRKTRELLRSARAIAQEAVVAIMLIDNEGSDKAKTIATEALAIINGLETALVAMDTDPSFRIAQTLALVK